MNAENGGWGKDVGTVLCLFEYNKDTKMLL